MDEDNLRKLATVHSSTVEGLKEVNQEIERISRWGLNPLDAKFNATQSVISLLSLAVRDGKEMRNTSAEIHNRVALEKLAKDAIDAKAVGVKQKNTLSTH
jgi:hypothetical protein